MKENKRFKRWSVKESDLADMTPVKARDLLIECFYNAQKETFLRARKQLGVVSSDEDIYASVVAGVRKAFIEVDGDFDRPTKAVLSKVLEILVKKSISWETPKEIIEHHKSEIKKILEKLKE